MLLKFSDAAFVTDFLTNRVGLAPILAASYALEDFDLKDLALASVLHAEFASPTLQTIRVKGTEEQIIPSSLRSQMTREFRGYGRLAWVDVTLDVLLATKMQDNRMPIDSITTEQLLDKIGGAATLNELKTKLTAMYSADVVNAMFQKFRITTIAEFKERLNFLVTFLFKEPDPFDGNDPANSHLLRTTVCVNFQPDLNVSQALQNAKLSRSILDGEQEASPAPEGIDPVNKQVFVTVFPDSVAVDGAIPGMTAAAIKTAVQNVFTAEGMIAHFFA